MEIYGLDCGTGNMISATPNEIMLQRNAFLSIDLETTSKAMLKRLSVPYIQIDGNLYIVGKDAFNYANIFNDRELRRPMKDGLLNPTEKDALPVLKHIIGKLVKGEEGAGNKVYYSVPAPPIDKDRGIAYHEDTIAKILTSFGMSSSAVNEGVALANAGLEHDMYTGIAISFGAGMANVAIMYMGMSALQFSVSKSGDWIDSQVSEDCGITTAKASKIKEKADYNISPDTPKIDTREHQAIKSNYEALIRYVLANIAHQFSEDSSTPEFPNAVPIVLGGGTSMAPGFVDLFRSQFTQSDFPIDISEIRLVHEPLTAVARGCLIAGELDSE